MYVYVYVYVYVCVCVNYVCTRHICAYVHVHYILVSVFAGALRFTLQRTMS